MCTLWALSLSLNWSYPFSVCFNKLTYTMLTHTARDEYYADGLKLQGCAGNISSSARVHSFHHQRMTDSFIWIRRDAREYSLLFDVCRSKLLPM